MAELTPVRARLDELGLHIRARLAVEDDIPRLSDRRSRLVAGYLCPSRIGVDVTVVRVGLEDADWSSLGEQPEPVSRGLYLTRLLSEPLRSQEETREHGDLGAKLVGVDGCGDEVDGALPITVGGHDLVVCIRRNKDDRCHLGLLAHPDERGRPKAVHGRHVDVQQDYSEILLQDAPQCGHAGVGFHNRTAERCQHRLDGHPLRRVVVHHEHRGPRHRRCAYRGGAHHPRFGFHAAGRSKIDSQGLRAAISKLVSMGLGT